MSQYITNRDIVESNKKALAEGRLVAQHKPVDTCAYVYEVPMESIGRPADTRCAIGACLSAATLAEVKRRKIVTAPLSTLLDLGVVSFEDDRVAQITQRIFDSWAVGRDQNPTRMIDYFPGGKFATVNDYPTVVNSFFSKIEAESYESLFRLWIEHLDKHCP